MADDAGGADDRSRAGRYVLQPAGYRAFVPAPLPPRPPIRMTGTMPALLSAAVPTGAVYLHL